jgi:hypothetical protein
MTYRIRRSQESNPVHDHRYTIARKHATKNFSSLLLVPKRGSPLWTNDLFVSDRAFAQKERPLDRSVREI